MAILLGETEQYKSAFAALQTLKGATGNTPELRAIALFLLFSANADAPSPLFPFVGIDDPRDRAIVEAYERAWKEMLEGDDE